MICKTIKSDYQRYIATGSRGGVKLWLFNYGFIATSIYRVSNALHNRSRRWFFKKPINAVNFFFLKFCQLFYGISIPASVQIGAGLFISHNGPIVINGEVVMGENCNIGPMTVIGWGRSKEGFGVPTIGDRVFIAPGAIIFGPIQIGNDVAIGANAVVNFDVPDKGVVIGNPGQVISFKGSSDYIHF